ncbi:MAG TPA: VWA domain-containing protein, partial [Anaerolineales bacterium]|nr:VWA domain-containing protein [Anaerolineales bacterium]
EALSWIELARKDDFYHATRCFLVHKAEEMEVFNLAFELFWTQLFHGFIQFAIQPKKHQEEEVRGELLLDDQETLKDESGVIILEPDEVDLDTSEDEVIFGTYSPVEVLAQKDFADLSAEELEIAKHIVRKMVWQLDRLRTRRQVRAVKRAEYLDLNRSIRQSMNQGGELIQLAWRRRKSKPRPLIVICDVSGSMERYSQMFLHFLYALVQESRQVEVFVFGTSLSRITPALRHNEVDNALEKVSQAVLDWSGGTRIGASLKQFNFHWSRRVLGRGAVAIIISDGWDRGDLELLEREISRLHRSVARLSWFNPLLGAPDYQPLVQGIQTILPHVDDFLPLHNLESFQRLVESRKGI